MRTAPLAILALLAVASISPAARAADATVPECLAASNASVKLRADHKLRQARAQLMVCVAASCPAEVIEECSRRMEQLTPSIPTIVFEAKDSAGRELSAVTVTMDGEVVTDHLDGTALTLDPGTHQFTFEAAGMPATSETLLLREGDKSRQIPVVIGAPATPLPATVISAPPPEASLPTPVGQAGHGRRVLGVVAGSLGLAGLAVGGIFGGLTISSWSSVNGACPSHAGCSTQVLDDHSNAVTFGTVSDVGFIAGGVLLAAGLTLYLTAPKPSSPTVGLEVTPGKVGIAGRF